MVLGVEKKGTFRKGAYSFGELFSIAVPDTNTLIALVIDLYTSDWQSPMCSTLYFNSDAAGYMLYGVSNNTKARMAGSAAANAPTFYIRRESANLYHVYGEFRNTDATTIDYVIRKSIGVN